MARAPQSRTLKICEICGKEFMGIKNSKLCSNACRKEACRIRDAIRRVRTKKEEMSDLARVNEEARDSGMSYGYYSDLLRQEKERPAEEARKEKLRKMFKRKEK